MAEEIKRVFFGCEVLAPWPDSLPHGRLLDAAHRHMTLAFLGETPYEILLKILPDFPKPPFTVGFAGHFDKCLFLPERHPHVVAWHVDYLEEQSPLLVFQKTLVEWLKHHDLNPRNSDREFLPHVTLCRSPFSPSLWRKAFVDLPMIIKDIHLYESVGNLKYEPLWSYPLTPPFEELEHTADIAFLVNGATIKQIHVHSQIALAFKFPPILPYFSRKEVNSIDELIVDINEVVAKSDAAIGIPFKAVSFHGEIKEIPGNIKQWEMIVDV